MTTAISLFSGIGGLDLAFAWAGFDILAQVEIDPFCRKVLAKHAAKYWPNARIYEDVRYVGYRNLDAADIIFAGFPCQPVSVAGKRKAQQDSRWLWPEVARIVGDLRPRAALLENVPGILSAGAAGIIADLAALGYDAEWGIVPASAVGAPHRRERWWCVAYPTGISIRVAGGQRESLSNAEDGSEFISDSLRVRRKSPFSGSVSGSDAQRISASFEQKWYSEQSGSRENSSVLGNADIGAESAIFESRLAGSADGLSAGMDEHRWPAGLGAQQHGWEPPRTVAAQGLYWKDRVRALGNAAVPQAAYPIACAIKAYLKGGGEQDHD